MSEQVQFDENQDISYQGPTNTAPKKSLLMRLAFKMGAKDERQANIILIFITITFSVIALFLFVRLLIQQDTSQIDYNDLSPELKRALQQR